MGMNNTNTINAENLVDCPKCMGSGRTRFRHIENGVCFRCKGSGKLTVRASTTRPAKIRKQDEWCAHSITAKDLSICDFTQLSTLRDFAHSETGHRMGILPVWMERGERFFQDAQSQMRQLNA